MEVVVDAHHHYFDPSRNAFSTFLESLGAPAYLPEQYAADCGAAFGRIVKTVHVEAMSDDGAAEAAWVASMAAAGRCPKTVAIVANCDLAAADAAQRLDRLAENKAVRGVRWILDCDGRPFDPQGKTATHIFTTSHAYGDLLRGPHAAAFERGFALLAPRHLSFDLQCAPAQLPAAAALFFWAPKARHPEVKVAISHLGKPRGLDGSAADAPKLDEWRAGMRALAALPQCYVKVSMVGFAVPGWCADPAKEAIAKGLVLEVVDLFGADRCMVATNFHINAAISDADAPDLPAPTIPEFLAKVQAWIAHLPHESQVAICRKTAENFYRIS